MIIKILLNSIIFIMSMLAVFIWCKKINPETTWIYFIYVLIINIIFSLFVWIK